MVRHLSDFESIVPTGIDAEGYPYGVRNRPRIDPFERALLVDIRLETPVGPGPASLLCHRHDENLWNLKSLLVRGTLVRGDGEWTFRPERFVPGAGIRGADGDGALRRGRAQDGRALPGEAWSGTPAYPLGRDQRDQSADQRGTTSGRYGVGCPAYHSTSFQISGCSSPSTPTSAKMVTACVRWRMASSERPAAWRRSARLLCSAASR
jgi:hypothetical protein